MEHLAWGILHFILFTIMCFNYLLAKEVGKIRYVSDEFYKQ